MRAGFAAIRCAFVPRRCQNRDMARSRNSTHGRRNSKALGRRGPSRHRAASVSDSTPVEQSPAIPTFRQMVAALCAANLPAATYVLVQTYATARKSEYILNGPGRMMSVHGQWLVVAGDFTISYLSAAGAGFLQDQFDIHPGEEATLKMTASVTKSGPQFHIALIAPIEGSYSSDTPGILDRPREVIREATAMVALTCGDDFIHRQIYENVLDLRKLQGHLSDVNVSLTVGIAAVQGNYDDAGRADLIAVGTAVATMKIQSQRLVNLGLRWFDRSRVSDGPLPYLFRWLALNSLSLSIEASDPVNGVAQLLAKAYNITEQQAKTEFSVGRLYGLRGQIAHGQADTASHAQQELVRAIFRDCLMACVDVPCRPAARAAIAIYGPPF